MAHDVAETTLIPRGPKGREEASVQTSRLLHAHEIALKEARTMAATTEPMTYSSATSSVATNCRCGLSQSMWSTCH
jgi:hypothetical protein